MIFKKPPPLKLPSIARDIEWKSLLGWKFRRFFLPGFGVLLTFSLMFFLYVPISQKNRRMQESIQLNELRLKELVSLSRHYQELKGFNAEIDRKVSQKGARFELLSFLEEVAKRAGIGEKISSMTPTDGEPYEHAVSITLRDLSTEELTEYLHQIINSENVVTIKKMHLKVIERGQRSLEASLVVSTLKSIHTSSPS